MAGNGAAGEDDFGLKDVVKAGEGEIFDVELEESVLKANRELAIKNRRILREHGITAT